MDGILETYEDMAEFPPESIVVIVHQCVLSETDKFPIKFCISPGARKPVAPLTNMDSL